jgi:hypothetical protein
VSLSTRMRLPVQADPGALNPNSFLLTLTQKHLKIKNVGSVWMSTEPSYFKLDPSVRHAALCLSIN